MKVTKVDATCGDCGTATTVFAPKGKKPVDPACADCAHKRMKAKLAADPVAAARFVKAVLG